MNWNKYEDLIRKLIQKIRADDYKIDHIIAIGRGGIPAGDALSRAFKVPLSIVMAKSYDEKIKGQVSVSIATGFKPIEGNILIVDDLVDSGETLAEVFSRIDRFLLVSKIKTAVIFCKPKTCLLPDYYATMVPQDQWIDQPFEKFDEERI